jgi:intracellular sulfur oxidation DsrE/DsrF family protein
MNLKQMIISATIAAAALAPFGWAQAQTTPAQPDMASRPNKVVFQVSDADPSKWNLALNNANNVLKDLGENSVAIEIVAYGPGIGMLKADSVVGNRIAEAMKGGVAIVACENTMKGQKLSKADMLDHIGYVQAGVVELMQRQKQGYAYIRP